ncbi:hypothetical protein Tco_0681642 [Tanacetum coccineum]|uniref:Xylulose kinase-1 n=1 Tax=Tanacetum coccineum TaxID=301880 RepID=A0ABQ4XNW7_9ASTR
MSSPKFAETHNVVAFLEKPKESNGFAEIIDFLKASSVHYALTVNPVIYTSCIEQFWATAKVQTVNGVRQLQALVDKKRVIVTESSIRRDLHLDDAEGTDCLPTATIFEELARMGAKSTAWNEFSSSMASLIICLATNQKFNLSKYIFDATVKHLDGGVKFLMYPHFLQVFINHQLGNMSTHKKIFVNPFHTKKVFTNMKRAGKDFSGRITPLFDTMMVQATEEVGEDSDHQTDSTQTPIIDQPSSSFQPKKKQPSNKAQRQEAEVPQDEAEHEESVPTSSNDLQPSGEDSMQLTDLMALCTKLQTHVLDLQKAKDAQAQEIAAFKKMIQRLERKKMSRPTGLKRLRKVGMTRRVESSKDQESLGAPEDASKQGRSIEDIDIDVDVSLVDETQERWDDDLMFDTGVLVPVEAKVNGKGEHSTKPDDSTAGEAVTTASVEVTKPKVVTTAATTTTTTRPKDRGVVVQEPSEFRVPQEIQPLSSNDKGKGIMIEPEVPLKRKYQIALDEQIVRDIQAKLDAELIEEQKLWVNNQGARLAVETAGEGVGLAVGQPGIAGKGRRVWLSLTAGLGAFGIKDERRVKFLQYEVSWKRISSGRITPLFDTMMVQPVEEIGEDSDHLTDSTPIPIIDQPSSSFNQEEINHLSRLRDMRQRFLKMRHNMRKVLDLQKEKDGSSKEIVCFAEEGPESLERTKCQDLQESLGAPEDASKQGRSIEDIDEDVDVSLVDETQESTKFDGT